MSWLYRRHPVYAPKSHGRGRNRDRQIKALRQFAALSVLRWWTRPISCKRLIH